MKTQKKDIDPSQSQKIEKEKGIGNLNLTFEQALKKALNTPLTKRTGKPKKRK